ncbi:hypothetical protein ACFOHK_01075 [Falsigemmobacter intermedius]|uniref:Uncharacterized protein n=1 Tax=Falsigemmobacter intermedius TaxID=1553448 RepID=A0A3S3UMW3_9RHOB|nr:hypothetical protein [Falsigemmobacter intermedius]RWY37347.1 hypothetical protein EP867_17330 [Falsigemmobacter intermedius]
MSYYEEETPEDVLNKKLSGWMTAERNLGANFNKWRDRERLLDYNIDLIMQRDYGEFGCMIDVRNNNWDETSALLLLATRRDAAASASFSRYAYREASRARKVTVMCFYMLIIVAALLAAICGRLFGLF